MFTSIPKGEITQEDAQIISEGILKVFNHHAVAVVPKWKSFKVINAQGVLKILFSEDPQTENLTEISGKFNKESGEGVVNFSKFNPVSYTDEYSAELLKKLHGLLYQALVNEFEATQKRLDFVKRLQESLFKKTPYL